MDHTDSENDKIAMIYVNAAKLDSIKERWVGDRNRKKQYAFVLHLEWSDGSASIIWRSYNDFFDFQCGLLDSFPEEAGSVRGYKRIIPYLPGIFFNRKGCSKTCRHLRVESVNRARGTISRAYHARKKSV